MQRQEYRRKGASHMTVQYSYSYRGFSRNMFKRTLIPMGRRDVEELYEEAITLLRAVTQINEPETTNEGKCKRKQYKLACEPLDIIETDIEIRTDAKPWWSAELTLGRVPLHMRSLLCSVLPKIYCP
ncbi:hypothetical protein QOT17_025265 [Balamuthia mandrillaris]